MDKMATIRAAYPERRHFPGTFRKYLSIILVFCCISTGALYPGLAAAEKAPTEIGGFKLGTSIEEYEFLSYRNFLKQVVVDQVPGFRKGVIEYGVCDRPGEIVRIKLKYLDTSKSFFDKLMKHYKKEFGEPDEFTGDSFGIVKSWKWHFQNSDGKHISMTLQHNTKNPNEVIGNMVKLYMPDQIEAERKCFNKTCQLRNPDCFKKAEDRIKWEDSTWQQLIPR